MTEVWLQSNRRVLLLALVPVILIGLGAMTALNLNSGLVVSILAWLALAFSLLLIIGLIFQGFRPRVTYRQNHVQFHLKTGGPIAVPVNVVEAFFLGQGPANLPIRIAGKAETVNLVARLSQRAPEWEQQDIRPALGRWCDGYVTIRGTWCEPLNGDVVRRLNRRLAEVSETRQATTKGEKAQ